MIDTINQNNITAKTWFKMTKSLLTNANCSSQIPTLIQNDITADLDIDKANILNDHFCRQSTVDDTNKNPPDIHINNNSTLSNINITSQEVKRRYHANGSF